MVLSLMHPFINRKYPLLKVVEVFEIQTEKIKGGVLHFIPLTTTEVIFQLLFNFGDAGVDAFAGSAGGCISMGNFDAKDPYDYSGALAKTLEKGIPVTVYYGKTDTACQYVGGQKLTDTIKWKGQSTYVETPYSAWMISGVEAGQIKSSGGLTYIGVESAGHMVPMDQPAASAAIIQSVIASV